MRLAIPRPKENQAAMKSRVLSTLSRLFTEPSGDGKQLIHSPGKVLVVSPGVSDRVADGIHPGTLRTARLVVDSNDYWNDYWNIVQYFSMGISMDMLYHEIMTYYKLLSIKCITLDPSIICVPATRCKTRSEIHHW